MKTFLQKHSYTLLLLGAVFLFSLFFFSLQSDKENINNYVTVTVSSGETLWEMAERYGNENLTKNDFIDWIEKHNQLQAESLKPGEKIVIPVEKDINVLASER
ncbi:LysM peptidoglycan-binding domain-containing protein [Peribacillus cavernae]|uniref:LysM peptidoglycan-binding domain-containing protein n=1 Tax=Peribacillus cavernae TaxID=1674310 RepID=A0A3S0VLU1_9BACI|nr:LysM peptidoglycan-binding domain-containing protein [Peribacillus cavernae]MDQ0216961.1 cell division protein YceG involved in septum cleavage [Peribacillus cavernae]RUQ30549.1 LysM peptidoglycan-binding domain-containing protein [Peribacillus cavernae]